MWKLVVRFGRAKLIVHRILCRMLHRVDGNLAISSARNIRYILLKILMGMEILMLLEILMLVEILILPGILRWVCNIERMSRRIWIPTLEWDTHHWCGSRIRINRRGVKVVNARTSSRIGIHGRSRPWVAAGRYRNRPHKYSSDGINVFKSWSDCNTCTLGFVLFCGRRVPCWVWSVDIDGITCTVLVPLAV